MDMTHVHSMEQTATSSSMDMDMTSTMNMDMTSSMNMVMVFHSNKRDELLSSSWKPNTDGQYAATCIFIIFFGIIHQAIHALEAIVRRKYEINSNNNLKGLNPTIIIPADEETWKTYTKDVELNHSQTIKKEKISYNNSIDENINDNDNDNDIINDKNENKKGKIKSIFKFTYVRPWRLSENVILSFLHLLKYGTSLLIMLMAMTFNLGYFLSILAGITIGNFIFGRFYR